MAQAELQGLVLAGGHSRRMGADKARVQLDGNDLLARTVGILRAVLTPVFVSVRADQQSDPLRAQYPLVVDVESIAGPAAGLLAAHALAPAAAWIVVAVDMPLLTVSVVRELVAARGIASDATAWHAAGDGAPEPLCAVYEPATLTRFAAHVAAGGSASPRAWLAQANVKYLADDSSELLRSANTPAELESLTKRGQANTRNRKANG